MTNIIQRCAQAFDNSAQLIRNCLSLNNEDVVYNVVLAANVVSSAITIPRTIPTRNCIVIIYSITGVRIWMGINTNAATVTTGVNQAHQLLIPSPIFQFQLQQGDFITFFSTTSSASLSVLLQYSQI